MPKPSPEGIIKEGVNFLAYLAGKQKPQITGELPAIEELEAKFEDIYGKQAVETPQKEIVGETPDETKQAPFLASQSEVNLPTSEETNQELKRRLAKELYRAELDLGAKLRIAGKPCDCLGYKHSLEIEAAAEELISLEPDNKVYPEIIEWLKTNQPKVSVEAISAGQYDNEYPRMAADFRDFRKRVMGTMTTKSLIQPQNRITLEEARALGAKLAELDSESGG